MQITLPEQASFAAGVSDSIIVSTTGQKTHVMLNRYSHANDERKRNALEKLPFFSNGNTSKAAHLRKTG